MIARTLRRTLAYPWRAARCLVWSFLFFHNRGNLGARFGPLLALRAAYELARRAVPPPWRR